MCLDIQASPLPPWFGKGAHENSVCHQATAVRYDPVCQVGYALPVRRHHCRHFWLVLIWQELRELVNFPVTERHGRDPVILDAVRTGQHEHNAAAALLLPVD